MSSRPPLNLRNLLNELESLVEWEDIGIQLEIPDAELKIIERECRGKVAVCKKELFRKWLSRVPNPTWAQIVEALRQIKLINLAEKIEEKCCHGSTEQQSDVSMEASSAEDVQNDLPEHITGSIQPVSLDSSLEDPSTETHRPTTPPESTKTAVSLGGTNTPDLAVVPQSAITPLYPPAEVSPERIADIKSQVKVYEADFRKLVCSVQVDLTESVSNSPNLLPQLCTTVFNIPASRKRPHVKFLAEKQEEIVDSPSVRHLISILSLHWDFINTPFLEVLVELFGSSDIQRELSDYVEKLGVFCRKTKLYEYKKAFPSTTIAVPPGFRTITVEFQADLTNYTLQMALEFGWQLSEECCLEKYTPLFVDFKFGSICLVWAIPRGAVSILVENLTIEVCKRSGIDAVYVDDTELHILSERRALTGEHEEVKDPSGHYPCPADLGPEDDGGGVTSLVAPPAGPSLQEQDPSGHYPGPADLRPEDDGGGDTSPVASPAGPQEEDPSGHHPGPAELGPEDGVGGDTSLVAPLTDHPPSPQEQDPSGHYPGPAELGPEDDGGGDTSPVASPAGPQEEDPSGHHPGPAELGPEDGVGGDTSLVAPLTDHPPSPQEQDPSGHYPGPADLGPEDDGGGDTSPVASPAGPQEEDPSGHHPGPAELGSEDGDGGDTSQVVSLTDHPPSPQKQPTVSEVGGGNHQVAMDPRRDPRVQPLAAIPSVQIGPLTEEENFDLNGEFRALFTNLLPLLSKAVTADILKVYLTSFCHPVRTLPYVNESLYQHLASTEEILKILLKERYFHPLQVGLLRRVVKEYGCAECNRLLEEYESKIPKDTSLERSCNELSDTELDGSLSTKKLKVKSREGSLTLNKVEVIQEELEKASGVSRDVIVYANRKGDCTLITFLIPANTKEAFIDISKSEKYLFKLAEIGILSIEIGPFTINLEEYLVSSTILPEEITPGPAGSAEESGIAADIASRQRKARILSSSQHDQGQAQEQDELAPFVLQNVEGLETSDKTGSGSYGSVYEVTVDGVRCIAKRLHCVFVSQDTSAQEREIMQQRFRQECLLLSKLKHPNIVYFMGVHYGRDATDLSLIMERLHTDLSKYLESHPNIPLPVKLFTLLEVSHGLSYLHTRDLPIIHRDLTASNVLLTDDMHAKIADLGMSKLFDLRTQADVTQTKAPGTLNYMPPEALKERPIYDAKLDIFSFGQLSLYTAIQEFPAVYEVDFTPEMVQEGSIQVARRKSAIDKMGTGHCLYPLVLQCLSDDPAKRPTATNLRDTLLGLCMKYPRTLADIAQTTGGTEFDSTRQRAGQRAVDDSLTCGSQWRSYGGYWTAGGEREAFLIVSTGEAAPAGNHDVIPLQGAGELTEEDRRELDSQGVPPDCCDDVSIVHGRITLNQRFQLSREEISTTGRELTSDYVLRQLEKFLNSVKKPGAYIHYIGHGKKRTGDWCFSDGFITFRDIVHLYSTTKIKGRVLTIVSNCSHSGSWVKECCRYLDELGVRACGHSAAEKGILLKVYASCRPSEVASSLAYSVGGMYNDKNTGLLTHWLYNKELHESQHTVGINFTDHLCGKTPLELCTRTSPKFTWMKRYQGVRKLLYLVRGNDRGRPAWHYVLIRDDEQTEREFRKQHATGRVDVADYGEVLKSGWGKDPAQEVVDEIDKQYG